MSRIDQDLRRGLRGLRESVDQEAAFRGVVSRKRRSRWLQPLRSASLAVLVLLGSAGGVYALWRVFDSSTPSTRPSGSVTNGLIAFQVFSASEGEPGSLGGHRLYLVDPSGEDPRDVTPDGAEYLTPAWSPDGKQMASVRLERRDEGAEEGIYVMDADGSDPRHLYSTGLPSPVSVLDLAWSPDGQRIAFIRAEYPTGPGVHSEADFVLQLFVMNADGTGARAITQPDRQVTSFSWSPNGQEIVFTRQFLASESRFGYDLFIMNADGTDVRRLTSDGRSMEPAWSPDGEWIAFASSAPEDSFMHRAIYLVRPDGTGVRWVTADSGTDGNPVWAPDGSRILFSRYGPSDECQLVTIDAEGQNERTLVDRAALKGGCASNPAWQPVVSAGDPPPQPDPDDAASPLPVPETSQAGVSRLINSEGGMIAFSDNGHDGRDIFAMSPDGSQVIPLVEGPGDDLMPRLTRDGRTLAYVGLAGPDALYVVDLEDGQARSLHLFEDDEQVSDMAWSPDGTEIALVIEEAIDYDPASPNPRPSFVHVLDVATGSMRRITDTGREHSVDWSPDGSRILFGRSEPQPEGEKFRPNDLYIIEPDGTGEERLTSDGLSMQGTWSPDGTHIVFESYIPSEGAQTDIYVMNADGTGRTRLTEDPGMDYYPVWSPDGSQILFVSRRVEGPPTGPSSCHLMAIGIDGAEERSIISDRSFICSGNPSWT